MTRTDLPSVRIRWKRHKSYEDAQGCHGVVYLFEGKGRPFYWGKADRSYFGGNKRQLGEREACARYCTSYEHLITSFLMLDGRLYIGEPTLPKGVTLDHVEDYLITEFPPVIPARPPKTHLNLRLVNTGDLPACLPRTYPLRPRRPPA